MRLLTLAAALSALGLLAGCVNVDYVGQTFPARPADSYVTFYNAVADVPATYKVIGRGSVNAPQTYTAEDIKALLLEKAAEVGADAVAINGFEKVLVSVNFVPHDDPEEVVGGWTSPSTSTTNDGTRIYTNTFGQQQSLGAREVKRYMVSVQAEFLVDSARFDLVMAELHKQRGRERVEEENDRTKTPADVMSKEKELMDAAEARHAAKLKAKTDGAATEADAKVEAAPDSKPSEQPKEPSPTAEAPAAATEADKSAAAAVPPTKTETPAKTETPEAEQKL